NVLILPRGLDILVLAGSLNVLILPRRLDVLVLARGLNVLILPRGLDVLILPCRLHVLALEYRLGLLRRAQTRGHRLCDACGMICGMASVSRWRHEAITRSGLPRSFQ